MADIKHITIITRKEAKALDLVRYFTGVPCKRDHISERITKDGQCRECAKWRSKQPEQKAKRCTSEYREKRKIWSRNSYLKNPDKMREKKRLYRKNNPEQCAIADKKKNIRRRKLFPYCSLISGIRNHPRRKGITCDLDLVWARARWTGKCEVTGIPFIWGRGRMTPFSPSIDRIDPNLGYLKENCRFVLFGYNALKGSGTSEEAMTIAKALVENHLMKPLSDIHCSLGESGSSYSS